MTGLHPETRALLDQIRALHEEAQRAGKALTLDQVAAAIGRSKGRAQQLWVLSGLPPLARGRKPGKAARKRKATPRHVSGARAGSSTSPAKVEAARANLETIRKRASAGLCGKAGRISQAAIDGMTPLELDLRIATAPARSKARWIRRKLDRGFTLTPAQAEILAIEERNRHRPRPTRPGSTKRAAPEAKR